MNRTAILLMNAVVIVLTWGEALLAYSGLPEPIPWSFDPFGQPTEWGGRWAVFIIPATEIALFLSVWMLARNPKWFRLSHASLARLPQPLRQPIYENFGEMFLTLTLIANALLFIVNIAFLQAAKDLQMMLPLLHLTLFSLIWVATAIAYLVRHAKRLAHAKALFRKPAQPEIDS